MELKNFFVQDDQGHKLPGAQCYLYQRGTESPASGAVKANGTPLDFPFTADNDGLVQLAAPNGLYDLRVTSSGRDYRIRLQFNDVSESIESAQAAAQQAEVARDAAQLSAGVYASTAIGLAATPVDGYFSVPSADSSEYLILYKNNAGSAEEQKRYPSASALDFKGTSDGHMLAVADSIGNVGFAVNNDGSIATDKFSANSAGEIETPLVEIRKQPSYLYAVADEAGSIILGVDSLGRLVANFGLVPRPDEVAPGPNWRGDYDYEINHIFTYGQSLSVGQALPIQTAVQKYDNLMFAKGQRPQYDYPADTKAVWYGSLVPSVEAVSTTNSALGETPSTATGDMIKERILIEDGISHAQHNYQLLLSAPGWGATTIAQLSKGAGTGHYERMIEQATYGKALANGMGRTYAVQAVTYTQGESDYISDTPRATYYAALNALVDNFNTDFKAASGQAKNIPMICYQLSSHKNAGRTVPTMALALLELAESRPDVYMACPMYQFDYADGWHLDGPSSRWLAAYYGLVYKRIVIDKGDWQPLRPDKTIVQGNICTVHFHVPQGPLVFDTVNVAANTNHGFELVDVNGVALTISSVSLIGGDRVKITAAAPIPAGAKIRYAWTGAGTVGRTTGPRGNLRDSQGDKITFDKDGSNKPMHNWCVIFEQGI